MDSKWIDRDGRVIFIEKVIRTVPYGFLGVIFGVYMAQLGFQPFAIGVVVTITVFTSAVYTLGISLVADRFGRKRTLIIFALMDFVAGSVLFLSTAWWAPVIAGIVGNMTVGAGEVGPFLTLEQAIIPQTCDSKHRTLAFTIYNLAGYGASSVGALMSGLTQYMGSGVVGYRPLFAAYLASGLIGGLLYSRLSKKVELESAVKKREVLSEKSKPIVQRLAGLFAIDAFGGGLVGQTILAYYFYLKFGLSGWPLALIFFGTQIITAFSFLAAERIARRLGLLNTMVYSHIPSNVFLASVPFAPTAIGAVFLLFCRQSLSQMDVPTRQSYVMAVVDESDRTPAAGLTNVSRSISQSISPSIAGYAMANIWIGTPLFAAGMLKLLYDGLIYGSFRKVKPPEEQKT